MNIKQIPLIELVNLANESSSELGDMGGGVLIDYESGKTFYGFDIHTATFLASAREIVLELARRIRELEQPYSGLSINQWKTLRAAKGEFGTSIRTSEETAFRQACQLVDEGLLTKEYDARAADGRVMFFYITIKGRQALKHMPEAIA